MKERSAANTSSYNLYRQGGGCQKTMFIFENHPYVCDGAGWFSCSLVRFSERHVQQFHAQFPSKLHERSQEMFP